MSITKKSAALLLLLGLITPLAACEGGGVGEEQEGFGEEQEQLEPEGVEGIEEGEEGFEGIEEGGEGGEGGEG